ncbi:hypothetical protein QNM97_10450 [Gordonia sp. L191]|uniref:hypothetical protein n=1 Tax=Gordonia sp. L191 TaxID=2982699 RepID=UPI0024BF7C19|nr:hypothetical protein [Gordonia sp. L191]WHU49353.1 hypothetical protein QNM97_10450 [Gordonia sp. L191]
MTDLAVSRCVWCSSLEDVAVYRHEPRCGRCRAAEQTVAEARHFIRVYGLRPLGASLESEDDEEREHRVAFREASAELRRSRTETPNTRKPSVVRRAGGTTSPPVAVKANGKATSTARKVGSGDDSTGISRPGATELMSRAEGLLAQLAEIEGRLEVALEDTGLSGKAKASDLTAKRDSVLRMLAALEKAKRAM